MNSPSSKKPGPQVTLHGLVAFSKPLLCSREVLGKNVAVRVGEQTGTLAMPALPTWKENEDDPLSNPLIGPGAAGEWKRGDRVVTWGKPTTYPSGESRVERALMSFNLRPSELDTASQQIYGHFNSWMYRFEEYVILLTNQHTHRYVTGGEGPGRIELLIEGQDGLEHVSRTSSRVITIQRVASENHLQLDQLLEAARLSSEKRLPRLEYRLLLEAYRARRNEDYRKAIIEAAAAVETCLESCISTEFERQDVSYGRQILKRYRALGGRFKLARIVGVPIPEKNYKSLIMEPRNDIVHRADFPDKSLANQVINEAKELLEKLSPQIAQESPRE